MGRVVLKNTQIKSNQIKSNQIKSNQIKSNQIKSSTEGLSNPSVTSLLRVFAGIFYLIISDDPHITT